MDFNKLNKIGRCEYNTSTTCTKRFEELVEGLQYKVLELRAVTTQYGDSIVAVTEDFEIFLPARIRKEMTDDDIKQFNEACSQSTVVMIYRGKKDLGEGKITALLEFKKL